MMLDELGPPLRPSTALRIQPDQILYEYDGPLIFTATLGVTELLFFKAEENDKSDIFIGTEQTKQLLT